MPSKGITLLSILFLSFLFFFFFVPLYTFPHHCTFISLHSLYAYACNTNLINLDYCTHTICDDALAAVTAADDDDQEDDDRDKKKDYKVIKKIDLRCHA